MFNDERINSESGRIYKNGILLATVISLFYGVSRLAYYIIADIFVMSFTEIFIILSGTAIILIDIIKFGKNGDERNMYERHMYYLKAGKIFLVTALSGYALSIPFYVASTYRSLPANQLIIALEMIGYIFLLVLQKQGYQL